MAWKDWSYWLKGGVILGIIAIVVEVIDLVAGKIFCSDPFAGNGASLCLFPTRVIELPIVMMIGIQNNLIILITSIVIWFLIGTIIGWIYGKIKGRSDNQKVKG